MRLIWGVWQTSRVFTPIFHSLGQQTKYDDGFGQIFGKYLTNIWLKPKACTIKSPVMGRRCRNGMNVSFYTTDGDQKQIKPSSHGKKTKKNMNVSQRLEEDEVYFRNYFERLCSVPWLYKWKLKIQLLVNKQIMHWWCVTWPWHGTWLDNLSSCLLVINIVIGENGKQDWRG